MMSAPAGAFQADRAHWTSLAESGELHRRVVHEPCVLDHVEPGSELAQREVFGPVLPVLPFDDHDDAFGGMKASGNGRDKSRHAVDKYTDLKTTWINLR